MTEKIYGSVIKETCLKYTAPGGLKVFMLPMEGYSAAVAQFSARFGSQDNSFSVNGGEFTRIPDGTAHYLEHKLFESEEKDAFSLFAQTGASCNAGTSFDYTQYYFSCADSFRKNLEILLDFVQDPYFTAENVEKERGIIGQEITMYRDNPSWRVFTNLLEGLYSKNPVRNDIAGTVESIAEITEKTLYDCYNAYYNPANMFLCVSGNFDPDEVIAVCESRLKSRLALDIKAEPFDEPLSVNRRRTELAMPVAKPIFEIGFKLPSKNGGESVEDYVYHNILFDIMLGDTSDFFEEMRKNSLLNEEFSVGVFSGRGHLFPFARGESDDPDRVLAEIQRRIDAFKTVPPSKEEFERIKRATYGALVRDFNNVDSVASTLSEAALADTEPFSVIDTAAAADYDRLLGHLYALDEDNASISIISKENL